MAHLPLILPDAYQGFLDAQFAGQEAALAGVVRRLSAAYVQNLPPRQLKDEERRAYTAYYGPGGALKVVAVLMELAQRGWRPPDDVLRLADLGAGPGTGTLGVALALFRSPTRIESSLLDRDPAWDPAILLDPFLQSGALRLVRSNSSLWEPAGPFDLVVAANVIVELDLEVAELGRRLHAQAEQALAPDGVLVIVEPATRGATRRLHALRDDLLARGLEVLAPCLHRERCPMLASTSDWCHEVRPWEQPRYHRRLDHLARLDKRRLQFSYLALSRRAPQEHFPPLAARVVSTVLREKGRTRFRTCDASGRLLGWDLLRRTGGAIADRVASLERGERLVLPHSRGGRIGSGDHLDPIVSPVAPLAPDGGGS